eukprot:6208215-Pleurochrysis_carterae.AAC.4
MCWRSLGGAGQRTGSLARGLSGRASIKIAHAKRIRPSTREAWAAAPVHASRRQDVLRSSRRSRRMAQSARGAGGARGAPDDLAVARR